MDRNLLSQWVTSKRKHNTPWHKQENLLGHVTEKFQGKVAFRNGWIQGFKDPRSHSRFISLSCLLWQALPKRWQKHYQEPLGCSSAQHTPHRQSFCTPVISAKVAGLALIGSFQVRGPSVRRGFKHFGKAHSSAIMSLCHSPPWPLTQLPERKLFHLPLPSPVPITVLLTRKLTLHSPCRNSLAGIPGHHMTICLVGLRTCVLLSLLFESEPLFTLKHVLVQR